MKTKDQILLEQAYVKITEMAYGISDDPSTQKRITKKELMDIILKLETERPGTTFVGITQVTKESTNKPVDINDPRPTRQKDSIYPMFVLSGLVKGETYFAKVTQLGGRVAHDYEKDMQKEMEKQGIEGEFKAGGFKSGMKRMEGSKIFLTKEGGEIYFYYKAGKLASAFKPVIVHATKPNPSKPEDFEVIDKQVVKQWQKEKPATLIPVRTVSLDSIAAIKINKNEYIITDLDPVRKSIYEVAGAPSAPEVVEDNSSQS